MRIGHLALVDDSYAKRPEKRSDEPPHAAAPIAIALETDGIARRAPRVTAKGRGALAAQILEIAFDRGIKVRIDADLAEILGAVELDSEIPLEALAAVAEILSYVYRAQASGAGER